MDKIKERITDYVVDLLREQGCDEVVDDDTSLVLSGLLDSFAVMRLVVFMEKNFGINFAEEYFDQTRFDTIGSMVELINELTSS